MSTLFFAQRVPRRSLASLFTFVNKDANELARYETFNGRAIVIGNGSPFYPTPKLSTRLNNYQAVSTGSGLSTSEKIR